MVDKRILVVNDLHCGSRWGVMPSRFEWEEDGQRDFADANAIQEILFREWKDMCIDVGKVYAVIVNGDTVDGIDYKTGGKYQWTSNYRLQAQCAKQLLTMISFKSNRRFYITQGSNYHTGTNMSGDEYLSDIIHAKKFGYELIIDVNGLGIHVCHFIGSAKSNLESEIENYIMHQEQNGKVGLILRAHKHSFKYAGISDLVAIQSPCWKAKEEFSRARGFKWEPQMGYIVIDVHDDGTFDWYPHTFYINHGDMERVIA